MVELEAITLLTYIPSAFSQHFRDFKHKPSLNFSNHGGIRSHNNVEHLQLAVKGFQHRESYLLYMKI